MGPKKNLGLKKILGPKKIWVKNNCGSNKIESKTRLISIESQPKKIVVVVVIGVVVVVVHVVVVIPVVDTRNIPLKFG